MATGTADQVFDALGDPTRRDQRVLAAELPLDLGQYGVDRGKIAPVRGDARSNGIPFPTQPNIPS